MTKRQKMTPHSHKVWPPVLLAGICIGGLPFAFWGRAPQTATLSVETDKQHSPNDLARPLRVVVQHAANAGPAELRQQFTGIVRPRRQSQLAAKALGQVEEVLVDLGDIVAQNQLLVRLNVDELQAERRVLRARLQGAQQQLTELETGPRMQDIDQAQAALQEALASQRLRMANLERTRSLRVSSSVSAQELDEAQYALDAANSQVEAASLALDLLQEGTRSERIEAARAEVASLEAEIERTEVRIAEQQVTAPYAGRIESRFVDEGSIVAAGQKLLEIVEADHLLVHVGLPPALAIQCQHSPPNVSVGGQALNVEFERLAPTLDEATRTREVVFRVAASDGSYVTGGMAVAVEVAAPPERRGLWIPTAALTSGQRGLWALYVVIPDQAVEAATNMTGVIDRRPVEVLGTQGEWSEVQGEISPQDQIVMEGVHRVAHGQCVVAVPRNSNSEVNSHLISDH